MPNSIIFRKRNKEGEILLGIVSHAYMKNNIEIGEQIIEIIGISQTDKQREYMTELSQAELISALEGFMRDNALYVERPN